MACNGTCIITPNGHFLYPILFCLAYFKKPLYTLNMVKSRFKTVREFVDCVGRKKLADQGAYSQVVHNWIQAEEISARWIPVFIGLYGTDLPWHLFNARQAKTPKPREAVA